MYIAAYYLSMTQKWDALLWPSYLRETEERTAVVVARKHDILLHYQQ